MDDGFVGELDAGPTWGLVSDLLSYLVGKVSGLAMQIFFNGQQRDVSDGITVAELLKQYDFEPRYVAVEVNLDLVPRERHQAFVLKADDRLEVVTLVGGG